MNLKYKEAPISIKEYLDAETCSSVKHELINGDIYAMAGASTNHNRIVANFSRELGNWLKNKPCEPFVADMKVQVNNNFFYPDVLVVCNHQANDIGVTDAPIILVEVLSKSTRQIDHTLKRTTYQQLPSLMEYVIIEQDVVDIEICRRNNHWQPEHYYLGDEVFFESIDFKSSVAEIYERVDNEDMQIYLQALAEQN